MSSPRSRCAQWFDECSGVHAALPTCCGKGAAEEASDEASVLPVSVENWPTPSNEAHSSVPVFPPSQSTDSASANCSEQDEAESSEAASSVNAASCRQVDARVFTFRDNIMLRGVQSNVVLRRRASLLSSAAGSATTFELSRPTDHLDGFISHNWCVGRHKKWLALSLCWNMLPAAVGSLLAVVIVAFMTVLGYQPLYASDGRRERDAPYCIVVGFLMFNSLLLFWPDLVPRRCSRHANLFLDKSCIHQVDLDLQRAGIESIGAFLFYSWSLVVLYSRIHTQKVWTVYEMACFLLLHPRGVWFPVDIAPVVLAASVANWFSMILVFIYRSSHL